MYKQIFGEDINIPILDPCSIEGVEFYDYCDDMFCDFFIDYYKSLLFKSKYKEEFTDTDSSTDTSDDVLSYMDDMLSDHDAYDELDEIIPVESTEPIYEYDEMFDIYEDLSDEDKTLNDDLYDNDIEWD